MSSVTIPTASRAGAEVLLLDRRVTIVGSLIVDGDVHLSGRVDGEVRCRTLHLAERGAIEGDVIAERAVVLGEVVGTVYANELVLKAGCTVEGQIFHRNLVLEDGCYFEGQSRRHGHPTRLADEVELARVPAPEAR